jgi:hypothetical protein
MAAPQVQRLSHDLQDFIPAPFRMCVTWRGNLAGPDPERPAEVAPSKAASEKVLRSAMCDISAQYVSAADLRNALGGIGVSCSAVRSLHWRAEGQPVTGNCFASQELITLWTL